MNKMKVISERCKGCLCCINQCPKGAISVGEELNSKGYQFVHIDGEKCIGCGICSYVCPDWVFESEVE